MSIRSLRKAKKMTMQELADACGVTPSQISHIENGKRNPSAELARRLADVLGVPVGAILGDDVQVVDDFVTFPVIGEIAAGYEHYAVEDWTGGKIDIPRSWLHGRGRGEYSVLRVSGQSMFPAYQDGDLVLILLQSVLDHSGQVAAVLYDDDKATLKRVELGDGWVRLTPINPQFPPEVLRGEELNHFRVYGIPKMLVRRIE